MTPITQDFVLAVLNGWAAGCVLFIVCAVAYIWWGNRRGEKP